MISMKTKNASKFLNELRNSEYTRRFKLFSSDHKYSNLKLTIPKTKPLTDEGH